MGIYDVIIVVSWVLVVVVLSIAATLMLGADWRDVWSRLSRRILRVGRPLGRH